VATPQSYNFKNHTCGEATAIGLKMKNTTLWQHHSPIILKITPVAKPQQ